MKNSPVNTKVGERGGVLQVVMQRFPCSPQRGPHGSWRTLCRLVCLEEFVASKEEFMLEQVYPEGLQTVEDKQSMRRKEQQRGAVVD